jgi:hypothetical protein
MKLKKPSGTLSTAEAISVINNARVLAAHFGNGTLSARDIGPGLTGAVIKDPAQDTLVWREYLETVLKERPDHDPLYEICREFI